MPAGMCRAAVRGLRASSFALMMRLADIPSVRTPRKASVIQTNTCQPGPSAAAEMVGRQYHPDVSERHRKQRFGDVDGVEIVRNFDRNRTEWPGCAGAFCMA